MNRKDQGKLLRAWRKHMGEVWGRKITLMALAAAVAELAEQHGYAADSRRIPGSHASMTRWELGDVDQSLAGLELIAEYYGVATTDLMRPPEVAAPAVKPTPAAEPDDMVEAFREFLESRRPA